MTKTTFMKKTDDIAKDYLVEYTRFETEATELLQEAVLKADRIKKDVLINEVNKQLSEMKENFKEVGIEQNKKIKALAKEVSDTFNKPHNRSDQHETKVANALQFIELLSDKLTDQDREKADKQAYDILKDFRHDFETMKLFKDVLETKVGMYDGNSQERFKETFEIYHENEKLYEAISEYEKISENIFLTDLVGTGKRYSFYDTSYSVPDRNYTQQMRERAVIDMAENIDALFTKVNEHQNK